MNSLPDILEQIKTHIQKKTRKRLNNGVLPSRGTHHNAIGSDFVWCSNRKQEGLNNYTGSIPVILLRLRYPAWIRRSPE